MIFGLWVPSYELSTSFKPFCKLDSQSHDISILIFEIQAISNDIFGKVTLVQYVSFVKVKMKNKLL